MSFEYNVLIIESHLDTFGHVNNATYLQLYEEARWDFITRNGYGLNEVLKRQVGPTLLEVELKFRREIKNRDKITIKTEVESTRGKIFYILQKMFNEADKLCSEARFTAGLFDMKARKLIMPTEDWISACGLSDDR